MNVQSDFSPIFPCTHFLNSIHKSWKKLDLVNFFFKNHFISSKLFRLHNLEHISLNESGRFLKFPPFWFLVQKVGASKSKGNSSKMINFDNFIKLCGIFYFLSAKWMHPHAKFSKLKKGRNIYSWKQAVDIFKPHSRPLTRSN